MHYRRLLRNGTTERLLDSTDGTCKDCGSRRIHAKQLCKRCYGQREAQPKRLPHSQCLISGPDRRSDVLDGFKRVMLCDTRDCLEPFHQDVNQTGERVSGLLEARNRQLRARLASADWI